MAVCSVEQLAAAVREGVAAISVGADWALAELAARASQAEAELGRKPEWVTCDYEPEKREDDDGGVPCRRAMSLLVDRAQAAEAEAARLREELDARQHRCAFPECVDGKRPERCGYCGDAERAEAAEARCARLRGKLEWVKHALPPSVSDELTEWLDEEAS